MADSPDVRALLLPSVEQISDSDDAVMEPDTVASPPRDVSESESFSPPCGLESPPHMRQKLDYLWRHSVPAPVCLGRILLCGGCIRDVASNEFQKDNFWWVAVFF